MTALRALLVYPTHENCREVAGGFDGTGVDAACYPARRMTPTAEEDVNCWNAEADEAEAMGLPVVKTVCPTCEHQKTCYGSGYLGGLIEAREATVALATHARAAYSSLAELAGDRPYVSIHENPIDLLRPTCEVSQADLAAVRCLVERVLSDPFFLNWLGDDRAQRAPRDADGEVSHDPEKKLLRERLYDATVALAELLDDLEQTLESAEATTPWEPPATISLPQGFERFLFWAIRRCGTRLAGSPWRLLLAALAGELHAAVALVSRRHVPGGGQDNPQTVKCVFGVRQNLIASDKTTWFNDATLEADRLRMVLGAPVSDETPDGRLELQHKALQLSRDVTRRTSPDVFLALLRAVICLRPAWRRVGLITHRPLLVALDMLEPEFRERIVMSAHFGSGQERSSNAWHEACDGIVVAGTPRVPPEAIARYLVQVGEIAAACEESEWGEMCWEGQSESGRAVTVQARGYFDECWRSAHRDLVRATLVQAIGRGRGLLEDGCDVLVLSTEECGLSVADEPLRPFGQSEVEVWQALRELRELRELTMEIPNKPSIGNSIVSTAVSTAQVAKHISLSTIRTRELLRSLEARSLIRRLGPRSGWQPVPDFLTSSPAPSPSAEETGHASPPAKAL